MNINEIFLKHWRIRVLFLKEKHAYIYQVMVYCPDISILIVRENLWNFKYCITYIPVLRDVILYGVCYVKSIDDLLSCLIYKWRLYPETVAIVNIYAFDISKPL